MIIVIIHWKIRPDEDSIRQFRDSWRQMEPPERANYVGEYLIDPLSKDKVGFACTTFNVSSSVKYRSFFNVGIWKDVDAYRTDIIESFVTRPILSHSNTTTGNAWSSALSSGELARINFQRQTISTEAQSRDAELHSTDMQLSLYGRFAETKAMVTNAEVMAVVQAPHSVLDGRLSRPNDCL
jgi:hypothetical protein